MLTFGIGQFDLTFHEWETSILAQGAFREKSQKKKKLLNQQFLPQI